RRPVPICRSAAAYPECSGAQLAARARHAGGLHGVATEYDTTGRCVHKEHVKERHAAMVGCGEPYVPRRLQYCPPLLFSMGFGQSSCVLRLVCRSRIVNTQRHVGMLEGTACLSDWTGAS